MSRRLAPLLLLLLALRPALAQTAAELVRDTVWTRLQSMLLDWARPPAFGPMLGVRWRPAGMLFDPPKSLQLVEADQLLAFVREVVDPGGWDERGATLAIQAGEIEVRQTRDHVEEVRRLLQAIDRVLAPRLRVEVVLFERSRLGADRTGLAAGLRALTADAASELRRALDAGRAILQAQALDVLAGSLLLVARDERRGYVRSVPIEAQGERVLIDPDVEDLRFGASLGFRLQLHPDGRRAVLFGLLTRRSPGPPGKIAVRTKEIGEVDRVTTAEAQLAFSLALDEGGAVVLVPGAETAAGFGVLLRLERLPAPGAEQKGILSVPASLLTSAMMEQLALEFDEPGAETDRPGIDALRRAIAELVPERKDRRPPVVAAVGEAVAVAAEEDDCARVRTFLAGVARQRARSFVVTLRCERRATDAAEWQPDGEPLVLPVLAERQAALFDGRGQTYLKRFGVEGPTTTGVVPLQPEIDAVFAGREVFVRVLPGIERCTVEVDLTERVLDAMRTLDKVDERHGPLEVPELRLVELDRTLRLAPGETAPLGSGLSRTLDGRTWQTRWLVELIERGGER